MAQGGTMMTETLDNEMGMPMAPDTRLLVDYVTD